MFSISVNDAYDACCSQFPVVHVPSIGLFVYLDPKFYACPYNSGIGQTMPKHARNTWNLLGACWFSYGTVFSQIHRSKMIKAPVVDKDQQTHDPFRISSISVKRNIRSASMQTASGITNWEGHIIVNPLPNSIQYIHPMYNFQDIGEGSMLPQTPEPLPLSKMMLHPHGNRIVYDLQGRTCALLCIPTCPLFFVICRSCFGKKHLFLAEELISPILECPQVRHTQLKHHHARAAAEVSRASSRRWKSLIRKHDIWTAVGVNPLALIWTNVKVL